MVLMGRQIALAQGTRISYDSPGNSASWKYGKIFTAGFIQFYARGQKSQFRALSPASFLSNIEKGNANVPPVYLMCMDVLKKQCFAWPFQNNTEICKRFIVISFNLCPPIVVP
ncbi:hypothetical protein AVEN_209166-1 [Araneus ventricosus]|uniref:Uncharacterized protein n=1 Tax=Araneus ventricosus TaxID=182803 RepID=A0A4Y2U452_ARAVE|nr:hypothetical protein AVEN_209166-1 [Araneus ventricosus]